ncbi:MAG: SEL1-like repeat protein [Holophagales bacterium]|jgi:TPR repeat protein/predicted RNase H-like HicB family nuclease|nr:SEL1-like repeat protein [Holophagales bacterium]
MTDHKQNTESGEAAEPIRAPSQVSGNATQKEPEQQREQESVFFNETLEAAKQGDADAQRRVGWLFHYGKGTSRDLAKAQEWWNKATFQNMEQSKTLSMEILAAAELEDVDAQYTLGEHYHGSYCTSLNRNRARAAEWWRRAAEQYLSAAGVDSAEIKRRFGELFERYHLVEQYKDAEALRKLGWIDENGEPAPVDRGRAPEWWQSIVEEYIVDGRSRFAEPQRRLTEIFEQHCIDAMEDDAEALQRLIEMYELCDGAPKRRTKAKQLRGAAEQGDAKAQWELGEMCYGPLGDDAAAAEWHSKAAAAGHANAQWRLGWMLEHGFGVQKDKAKAAEWYQRAAEQGLAVAQHFLGEMYYDGDGVQQDRQKAAEWWKKSAEQNYANAQYDLSWLYEEGSGVPKDKRLAEKWLMKAAEQDFQPWFVEDVINIRREMYVRERAMTEEQKKRLDQRRENDRTRHEEETGIFTRWAIFHKGYEGVAQRSKEEGCYIAWSKGLTSISINVRGATRDEAFEKFNGAIEKYLEDCEKRGIKPEQTQRRRDYERRQEFLKKQSEKSELPPSDV